MKLARINTALLVAIVLINGYVVVAPFWPRLVFWWQDRSPSHPTSTVQLQKRLQAPTSKPDIPADNRLLVPVMHLDEPIIEGSNEHALMQGPWRRPRSSTPDQASNTVIAGHRFTYTNPRGTFYFLDKVKVGDDIGIFWHGKKYVYIVREVKTVGPTDMAIEAATPGPTLTLYTCTPLWAPHNRLVVVARLESHD